MRVILVFVDGLGIGDDDPSYNPVRAASAKCLYSLMRDYICIPTDARLGIDGLPQSATGQTTILTGINASKAIGRHLNGFPSKTLRKIIEHNNIFKRLISKGLKVTNANMYTKEYLHKMSEDGSMRHISATTVATLSAGIPFRQENDMLAGKAVFQDITNAILIQRGYDVPLRNPYEAGVILSNLLAEYDFVLFEYFQTDFAGHSMDRDWCIKVIEEFDCMLEGLVQNMDFKESLLILTSDHGNIEDLRVATHTLNKVPTILFGKNAEKLASKICDLTDITPGIEALWE